MATVSTSIGSVKGLFADLAVSSGGGKKKDSKPDVSDPALNEPIDTYIARKQEAETATALAEAAAEQIVSAVRPERLKLCQEYGKVIASVSVNNRLTFTQTCRYSAVPGERKLALEQAFGDQFSRYFADTLGITLKRDSANDESVLSHLLESLGQEFFVQHFDIKRDLLVNEAFHNAYCTSGDVQAAAQPFIDDQTVRPYSPSLKIK